VMAMPDKHGSEAHDGVRPCQEEECRAMSMHDDEQLGRILHHERRRRMIDDEGWNPSFVPGWEDIDEYARQGLRRQARAVADAVRSEKADASPSLVIRSGDRLIIMVEGPMDDARYHEIRTQVEEFLPGVLVTVLDRVSGMAVYRDEPATQ
jgi:hypothetical protein